MNIKDELEDNMPCLELVGKIEEECVLKSEEYQVIEFKAEKPFACSTA